MSRYPRDVRCAGGGLYLLRIKQDAAEAYQIELEAHWVNAIQRELAYYESAAELVPGPSKCAVDPLDRVLREWT
ncbi:MAG TPA: hypothetical protein VIU34_10385 [Steroidobacter sp.]